MWQPPDVPILTAGELAARQSQGWMLLDVRTDEEWASGRIPGATHIPLDQLASRLPEVGEKVVCICAAGVRSARATQFLLAKGRDAVNLDGGVYEWAAEGRPLEV